MGNAPSKAPTEKKRRPTSFYGKKFNKKSSEDGRTARRRSLPATNLPIKEYNSITLHESSPNLPETSHIFLSRENYLLSVLEDDEPDQLFDEHYLHRATWGKNFMAPIQETFGNGTDVQVLDICCGNGRWMLEVAEEFPMVKFTGIDSTNTMPSEIKLPNVEFQQANFLEKLNFDNETFDFVHCRSVYVGEDWSTLINELVRVTKIGGYVELLAQDFNWLEDVSVSKLVQLKDVDFKPSLQISRGLHANSNNNQVFHQVRQEKLGAWGGKAGKLRLHQQLLTVKNLKIQVLNTVGMTSEEYDQTLNLIAKELSEGRSYILSHRFWVQKRK